MSVTMFAGTLLGTMLSFATQNQRLAVCKYLFRKKPFLGQIIGLALVSSLVLFPFFALTGFITITSTAFFLGGCFAYSFIISFALSSCTIAKPQHRARHAYAK